MRSAIVDILWPIARPARLPLHHQYNLYSAISRLVPAVHQNPLVGIHSIRGMWMAPGLLEATTMSSVAIRAPVEQIPLLLPLSGRKLDIAGFPIRLSVPQIREVRGDSNLMSSLVTIKGYLDPEGFEAALRRQLDNLGVSPSVITRLGQRRVLKVKQQTIVGYAVELNGLGDNESVDVLHHGLGGRRHLGCGLFVSSMLEHRAEGTI